MTVIRLIGGLTPGDASDPRTFPEIFNAAADVIDASEAGLSVVEGDIVGLKDGSLLPDATTSVAGVVRGTTSDGSNTALGLNAFTSNTTGDQNTAVGRDALRDNTTGDQNTAVGRFALLTNTTGTFNTAIGMEALRDNTTGENNTALGRRALRLGNGSDNTMVGTFAGSSATGTGNAGVGSQALIRMTSGTNNTALGQLSNQFVTTGSNNATLGSDARNSSGTASNQVTLGNTAITALRCNVTTISSLSDVRDKTDIVDTQHGLDTLNKIRPVDFTWARRDGTFGSAPDIGFIAQELASVEDETGDAQRLRLTLRDNPEKLEATPGRLIPILVKAVQELSAKNDELEARLVKLEGK